MKKQWLLLVLMLISPVFLYGSPTLNGPSGLITVPTAQGLKYKEFNLSADYITYDLNADKTIDDDYFYKLNLGTFENFELGFVGGRVPTEGVFVNLKYFLLSDASPYPLSVAVGVENLTSESDTGVYMVASKLFEGGVNAHLGFKAVFATKEIDPTIMGGMEYIYNNSLSVLADINGQESRYAFNAGIRYFVTPELSLRAYAIDIGKTQHDRVGLSLGFSYSKFL